MKIKEVEQKVGIGRANIRYYEKEGLLNPERNVENNYREYTEEDVRQLQRIKVLRLLGITPSDIKLLNMENVLLEDIMKKRLEQLKNEEKEIQNLQKICETILERDIDMRTLNEEILAEDKDKEVWKVRLEEILAHDIVKEPLVKKQLNKTVAFMLSWGYFISILVTLCLSAIEEKMGSQIFTLKSEKETYLFFAISGILILSLLVMYFTSNIVIHFVVFNISALLLAPFAMGVIRGALGFRDELFGGISTLEFAVIWTLMLLYVIILYVLSEKWGKIFEKVRYALIFAIVFSIVCIGIVKLTCENWILTSLIFTYLSVLVGLKWTITVGERTTYNRYYAIRQAGAIVNFIGLHIAWQLGGDREVVGATNENDSCTLSKCEKDMKGIQRVIKEKVDLEFYEQRSDGVNLYKVTKINNEDFLKEYVLLVALKSDLNLFMSSGRAYIPTDLSNYHGTLWIFKCKEKKGLFHKKSIKVMETFKKAFHKIELENGEKEIISLEDILN